ncbi:MAG TPA: phage Gp37/Gp68 family protein [Terriglobia bacterium]|nr:phage Gp37/Gp68 family protein [Terriglobia bacterium]
MASNSTIEWTETTWNPLTGCSKISPGCDNCYAIREARRLSGNPSKRVRAAYEGTTTRVNGRPNWTGLLRTVSERREQPLHWAKPRRIFVNSMSDLFHDDVPTSDVLAIADVMKRADWHTYQVLTKRSARLRDLLNGELRSFAALPHIWWGVSVENRRHGIPRIDDLRQAPVVTRFLSVEPLLEDLGELNLDGIHWVIVGGESGPGSRPMQQDWVESIRQQCAEARVPFFFKQWGTYAPQDGVMTRLGKKAAGRILNGRTWDEYPRNQGQIWGQPPNSRE